MTKVSNSPPLPCKGDPPVPGRLSEIIEGVVVDLSPEPGRIEGAGKTPAMMTRNPR